MRGTTNVPCVCVIMEQDDKVLFLLRGDIDWKPNEFVVPSGHVEDNETFMQAATREVLEEVGLAIEPKDLEYKGLVHRKAPGSIRIDVWFLAKQYSGSPQNKEPTTHRKIEWVNPQQLPPNTVDYIRFGLDMIRNGRQYGEFGWND